MGLLRLLLALGVVTEHAGHTYFIGSYTAVQIFFIISGFYMELIFSSGKYRNANQFYASRIARLFPVYWIALITGVVVAYAVYACFGTHSAITLLEGRLSELQSTNTPVYIWAIFSNVFLLLADFAWFMPNIDGVQAPHSLASPATGLDTGIGTVFLRSLSTAHSGKDLRHSRTDWPFRVSTSSLLSIWLGCQSIPCAIFPL
jgi:peptidoglycan/LPS O-acetylase OafA/YrhL